MKVIVLGEIVLTPAGCRYYKTGDHLFGYDRRLGRRWWTDEAFDVDIRPEQWRTRRHFGRLRPRTAHHHAQRQFLLEYAFQIHHVK
ncbi:unnamed protein product, partial [Nesidiocoris tenuis]